jgi:hypothetical protein
LMATATSLVATATSWAQTEIAGMTTTPGYTTGTPPWTNTGTPNPNGTPVSGFGPPIQPGPGGDAANCLRPDNAINIAWWADYEVCRVLGFVSWNGDNSATVVAVPTMFAAKEPFASIGQVVVGINSASTQIAFYDWSSSGIAGINQEVDPNTPLHSLLPASSGGGPQDAWSGVGEPFDLNPSISGGWNGYSRYCSTQLSDILSARLSQGLCYALTINRQVGILPWVQFLINMLCIFGIVRSILQTLRFYGAFPAAPDTTPAAKKGTM